MQLKQAAHLFNFVVLPKEKNAYSGMHAGIVLKPIQVNGYSFRGSHSDIFSFASLLNEDQFLKKDPFL